jgi:hypothetical protein
MAISLSLVGCTILHSSIDGADGGIAYYLPKTVIVAKVEVYRRLKPGKTEGKTDRDYDYLVTFNTEKPNNLPEPTRGETIPDLKHRFSLTYSNNPFFNDRYCVSTTSNGLLTSVEYATEDATPKIALALAELGRRVGAGGFSLSFAEGSGTTLYGSVTVTFDPFDDNDMRAAARVVNTAFNNNVAVKFDFPDLNPFRHNRVNKCRGDRGVCFRTKVKTPMVLRDASGDVLTSTTVEVVNVNFTGHFDLDRAFMVEKIVRLGFDEGALSQVTMRKPSEVLQTVKLPLAIVEVLLAVPAKAVGGTNTEINNQLQEQQQTITNIQTQLASGLGETSSSPYKETCKGRTFNTGGSG